MLVVTVALLVAVVVLLLAGLHTGPHGLAVSGAIGFAAAIALALGFVALAQDGVAAFSWVVIGGTVALSVGAIGAGARSLGKLSGHAGGGTESGALWGADGVAVTDLTPLGAVRVRGETWSAESLSGSLPVGSAVHVVEVDGLRLRVWSDVVVGTELGDASSKGSEL